jgi:hypothetical protein
MNTDELITSFATAGLFGFANTLALEYFSFTRFDKRVNDDNKMWMLGFSLFNLLLFNYLEKSFVWTAFWSAMATLAVIYILPKIINFIRKKSGIASISQMHPWDAFWDSMGDEVFVYVFDFDNKFIENGALSHSTNSKDGALDVLLTPPDDEDYEPIDYEDLMSWLQPKNGKTIALQIYLDTTQKIKYVAFKEINNNNNNPIKHITFLEDEESK